MITLMSKKLAKNSIFGKLLEEGPYQNNWLFKIGRVCFYEKGVMKFIIKFSLTLPYQVAFTSLHLLIFLLGVLPRNGGQVLKKLLLENGCNLADDNDEKLIKVRKMKRRYFTDNLHLRRRELNFLFYRQSSILGW